MRSKPFDPPPFSLSLVSFTKADANYHYGCWTVLKLLQTDQSKILWTCLRIALIDFLSKRLCGGGAAIGEGMGIIEKVWATCAANHSFAQEKDSNKCWSCSFGAESVADGVDDGDGDSET